MKYFLIISVCLTLAVPANGQRVRPAKKMSSSGRIPVNQDNTKVPPAKQSPNQDQESQKSAASTKAKSEPKLADSLLKTSFSRTPVEILKAWTDTNASQTKSTDQPAKPVSGKVLNVFEDFVVVGVDQQPKLTVNQQVLLVIKQPASKPEIKLKASILSVDEKKISVKLADAKQFKAKTGDAVSLELSPSTDQKSKDGAKSIPQQVAQFKRDVMLANWPEVKKFLAGLPEEDADKVYQHLIRSLGTVVNPAVPADASPEVKAQLAAQAAQSGTAPPPSSFLIPADIFALIEAAPAAIKKEHTALLATLISKSRALGHTYDQFLEKLNQGTGKIGGEQTEHRILAAGLLMNSAMIDDVESYLPSLDEDATQQNVDALKIWSQLATALYGRDRIAKWLETAWTVNQSIVGNAEAKPADKDLAMFQLIELSPQVDKELGQQWLNESFSASPERGMRILSSLGIKSAELVQAAITNSPTQRIKLLRLQNNAVESLIKVAPETAAKWKQALTLLAQNWISESNIAIQNSNQTSRQAYMQIDMYGNYYWVDQQQMLRNRGINRRARPVKIGDLLEIRPSQQWHDKIDTSLHIQLFKSYADLHLRINEEDKAFPFIERIAPSKPKIARDLVHQFLRIWTSNHDPNTDKRRRNPYIYFYGFDRKADAIPLTRSKQERNLRELSGWVKRIRELPIKPVDEKLLAGAFTTCHSSAEVFHLDRVKSVFGSLESLQPETIAAICQKMRTNLVTNWRDIRNQEAKQTRRREPEVQQEVMRGYGVAQSLAQEALKSNPDNWQLHLALACLMYDENAYSQTVQKSSEFSDRRDRAFDQFQVAADKYQDVVESLDQSKQSTEVYDFWFYASLGACDLGKITNETVPDLRQYKKVRVAIEALPGSMAAIHMSKFANNLFTRMNPVKPEIKFRYLRGGFEIVGDHPRAWEARNLYEYYRDLVNEIKLNVAIDGSDIVGNQKPFGVYVNLSHTTEIEREAGGFGKYVQNQNNAIYAFNYGRPTEDYRDKFQQSVNQALGEHFEVLNVTFEGPKTMRSRAAVQSGWRVTPYAYILLKSRGPEVDRIPPLKLDLDFLDTSGYVVVPIESPAVVVVASTESNEPRPATDVVITQTLDERRADEGKLIVEISATAKGLVPELEKLIDLKKENFEIVTVDDQGVLPTSFDAKNSDIQIVSDRSWTVEYKAIEGAGTANQFEFSGGLSPETQVKFQRYQDADLVASTQMVKLERNYARRSLMFLVWLIPLLVVIAGAAGTGIYFAGRQSQTAAKDFEIPEDINPFTVLTLLKSIRERNGIGQEDVGELQESINRIEQHFFSQTGNGDTDQDLSFIAENWVRKAN